MDEPIDVWALKYVDELDLPEDVKGAMKLAISYVPTRKFVIKKPHVRLTLLRYMASIPPGSPMPIPSFAQNALDVLEKAQKRGGLKALAESQINISETTTAKFPSVNAAQKVNPHRPDLYKLAQMYRNRRPREKDAG